MGLCLTPLPPGPGVKGFLFPRDTAGTPLVTAGTGEVMAAVSPVPAAALPVPSAWSPLKLLLSPHGEAEEGSRWVFWGSRGRPNITTGQRVMMQRGGPCLPASPGSAFPSQLEQEGFYGVPLLTGFHLLPAQVEMSRLPPRSQETGETGNFYR